MTQKSNANEFTGIRKPLLLSTTTLTLASMIVMAVPAQAQVAPALETPTGEVVVGGGASFSRPTVGQLNVT